MQNIEYLAARTVSKPQRRQTKTWTPILSYQEPNKEKTMFQTLLATGGHITFTYHKAYLQPDFVDNERNTVQLRKLER